jgi:hypothetical protein
MKILIWVIALIVLTPWTAGAWVAYMLVDVSGHWMSGNADMLVAEPEVVETLSWLARLMAGVGETVIIAVWAIGAASVSLVAWMCGRLVDRQRRKTQFAWHPDDPRAAAGRPVP